MLRVIAGTAKGLQLATPRGSARPTLDRVREAVFSILHPYLAGARFADLYAGSGANGIEALSRGAVYCVFVDSDYEAIDTIGKNLFHTKLEHKARSYQLTLPRSLAVLASSESPFDIVYCDPPFEDMDYDLLLMQLADNKLLTENGRIVIEHVSSLDMPQAVGVFTRQRTARYGRIGISVFT